MEAGLHTHTEATVYRELWELLVSSPRLQGGCRCFCVSRDPHFEDGASCLSYPYFSGLPASSSDKCFGKGLRGMFHSVISTYFLKFFLE